MKTTILTLAVLALGCATPQTRDNPFGLKEPTVLGYTTPIAEADLIEAMMIASSSVTAESGETDDELQLRKALAAVEALLDNIPPKYLDDNAFLHAVFKASAEVKARPGESDTDLQLRKGEAVVGTILDLVAGG